MFGGRFFSKHYFGAHYFGPTAVAALELTLDATDGADDASFAAQVSIDVTLNVSKGLSADSTEVTADDTTHTADEDGTASRQEHADTAAFQITLGTAVVISHGGGAFRPRHELPRTVPPIAATLFAIEAADHVSARVTVETIAELSAVDGPDSVSFSCVVAFRAALAAVEAADTAHMIAETNLEFSDDEILAAVLAEAA